MKNRAAIAITMAFCFVSPAMAEHFHVFIFAGQSNMDGRGRASELVGPLEKWAKPQADVRIMYSNSTIRGPFSTETWQPLGPGYSVAPETLKKLNKQIKLPSETFGPELSFGRFIAAGMKNKHIAIIKFSEGGTTLRKDWDPETRGALYDQKLAFVNKSLKSLTDNGDTYELSGFVWHQGESDSSLPDGEYQKLLTHFIDRVRGDFKLKDLLFVIGEVFDNGKRNRVRAGERATTQAVTNTLFVSAAGLVTSDNGTHFDTASQIELGRRISQAVLERRSVDASH